MEHVNRNSVIWNYHTTIKYSVVISCGRSVNEYKRENIFEPTTAYRNTEWMKEKDCCFRRNDSSCYARPFFFKKNRHFFCLYTTPRSLLYHSKCNVYKHDTLFGEEPKDDRGQSHPLTDIFSFMLSISSTYSNQLLLDNIFRPISIKSANNYQWLSVDDVLYLWSRRLRLLLLYIKQLVAKKQAKEIFDTSAGIS